MRPPGDIFASSRDAFLPGARAVVAWSSGKDSAWACHLVRQRDARSVVGLLTTVTVPFRRVSMHGVRMDLVEAQAAALGLPVYEVGIPYPCPNEVYEERMGAVMRRLVDQGVTHVIFGDLFLEDVRRYRERQLEALGVRPVFPLWGRDTRELAIEMIDGGLETVLVCVDPRKVPANVVGRWFTRELLTALPPRVDPCGENGEFHTFVAAGPMFSAPLEIEVGPAVTRDGFVFADATLRR